MVALKLDALNHLEEHGYVVIRGLLDVQLDIQPVIAEYEALLSTMAERLLAEGKLSSTYCELPFGERLTRIVIESEEPYGQAFDISLPQTKVTETTPMHLGPAAFNLLRSPRLLDAVEQIIGPEIYSNPVQHNRIKLPESQLPEPMRNGITSNIGWHQDLGVLDPSADQVEILTVWLPLVEATVENGCLAVVPGTHKGELATHCPRKDPLLFNQVVIPDALVGSNQVYLPMQPGDVLIMYAKTKHCGLPNESDRIRWSFDLRYQRTGEPTGRPWFPGFVARSRANPQSELTDHRAWAQLWRDTRSRLAAGGEVEFNRWSSSDPLCA